MEGEMAEKALSVVEHRENQLVHPVEFNNEQVRLLAETVAKGCDQNELAFFLNVCKLKRLDPFTGQVHCVKRWDSTLGREKMSIQVGIDGFRVIAARSNELAGISEPTFDSEDGQCPIWAHVTVYRYGRDNEKIPYSAKARYSEYMQTKKDGSPNHMWATKPYIMLGKCAEALALRKAFPDELSGMYSDDEMGQADNETGGVTPASVDKKKPVQQPQRASEKAAKEADTKTQTTTPSTGGGNSTTNSQQQAAKKTGEKEISGIIETAKQAKSGTLWVMVKGEPLAIAVDEKNIDGDMVTGNFIKFRGLMKWTDKLKTEQNPKGEFWSLIGLIELSKVQEAEPVKDDGKLAPDLAATADELFGKKEPQGQAAIEDLKKNGQVTTASQLPEGYTKKAGSIGWKKARRLDALCSQNKKANNNFTHDEMKKILAELPVPVLHVHDMEEAMYAQFEKWSLGEEDWREFWSKE